MKKIIIPNSTKNSKEIRIFMDQKLIKYVKFKMIHEDMSRFDAYQIDSDKEHEFSQFENIKIVNDLEITLAKSSG